MNPETFSAAMVALGFTVAGFDLVIAMLIRTQKETTDDR